MDVSKLKASFEKWAYMNFERALQVLASSENKTINRKIFSEYDKEMKSYLKHLEKLDVTVKTKKSYIQFFRMFVIYLNIQQKYAKNINATGEKEISAKFYTQENYDLYYNTREILLKYDKMLKTEGDKKKIDQTNVIYKIDRTIKRHDDIQIDTTIFMKKKLANYNEKLANQYLQRVWSCMAEVTTSEILLYPQRVKIDIEITENNGESWASHIPYESTSNRKRLNVTIAAVQSYDLKTSLMHEFIHAFNQNTSDMDLKKIFKIYYEHQIGKRDSHRGIKTAFLFYYCNLEGLTRLLEDTSEHKIFDINPVKSKQLTYELIHKIENNENTFPDREEFNVDHYEIGKYMYLIITMYFLKRRKTLKEGKLYYYDNNKNLITKPLSLVKQEFEKPIKFLGISLPGLSELKKIKVLFRNVDTVKFLKLFYKAEKEFIPEEKRIFTKQFVKTNINVINILKKYQKDYLKYNKLP